MPTRTANPKHPAPTPHGFDPVAGVLAYVLPGLGYFYRREARRGVFLLVGVLGLVIVGLLIGGVDVVDRVEDRWWFLPQAGMGPLAWGLDHLHRGVLGVKAVPSIGRVNEIGTLFVVMAGMLNAIAVIDCLLPALRDEEGNA